MNEYFNNNNNDNNDSSFNASSIIGYLAAIYIAGYILGILAVILAILYGIFNVIWYLAIGRWWEERQKVKLIEKRKRLIEKEILPFLRHKAEQGVPGWEERYLMATDKFNKYPDTVEQMREKMEDPKLLREYMFVYREREFNGHAAEYPPGFDWKDVSTYPPDWETKAVGYLSIPRRDAEEELKKQEVLIMDLFGIFYDRKIYKD